MATEKLQDALKQLNQVDQLLDAAAKALLADRPDYDGLQSLAHGRVMTAWNFVREARILTVGATQSMTAADFGLEVKQ